MPLESASRVSELVPTNPAITDIVGQGDDHLRMIKRTLLKDAQVFDDVASMKAVSNAELLPAGAYVRTIDYYSTQRGGGASYLIKTTAQAAADGDVYSATTTGNILLDNGNVAVLQIKERTAFTSQFGGGETGFIGALEYLQVSGGGTVFVDEVGTVILTDQILVSSWTQDVRITSSGKDITEVKINTGEKAILTGVCASPLSLQVDNITFRGYWADEPKQASADAWLINISNTKNYYQTNAKFVSSQKGLVKVKASNKAESTFCEGAEASRGGFNFSGSGRINCLGNEFVHLGDDAISAHTPINASFPYGSQHHIVSNTMRDCQGIVSLGARNSVIQGNTGKLIRVRFIYVGYDPAFGEGFNTTSGVIISGNSVEDCLNKSAFDGGATNVGYYMRVEGYSASTGGTLNSFPATNYAAGPSLTPLYGNMNGLGDRSTNVISGGWNIVISDNIVTRTEAGGVLYSSYGQVDEYTQSGDFFTEDGYTDAVIDESEFNLAGLELSGSLHNFSVTGGLIQTGYRAIRFLFSADDPRFTGGYIGGGINLVDAINDVVSTNASSGNYPNTLDVTFNDVVINGDPYFRSPLRSALDGTWSDTNACRAFNIAFCVGMRLGDITFKNISKRANASGGATSTVQSFIGKLTYQCDPVNISNNTGNKGIRDIDRPSDVVQHEIYDCDPSSSSYSQLQRSAVNFSSTSMPTSGKYIAGEFVRKTNPSVSNSAILIGWQRMTTGTGHTLNTDWREQYVSTVSPI